MTPSRNVIDQQVDDLRLRMRLLQQDRRANVELLEANKNSNAEEIKSLREDNKKLRLQVTQLQKRLSSDKHGTNEIAILQREALKLRTEFDSLKLLSTKQRNQITKLKDEAKICDLEAIRPTQEDGPIARKIRMLENKLDKAMIKYNEAQSIRSTYEHIVKRLKEERLSFNNQLSALERTLKAKKRDYEELLLLSGDANHAREVAQHELHQARCEYEEKRSRRSCEIRERQQVVKIRLQMLDKQERREISKRDASKQQQQDEKYGDINDDGTHELSFANDQKLIEEQERTLQLYEDAYRKIKEVTGVSDVNDVIEKVKGQSGTYENLVALTKQNQNSIEKLNEKKSGLIKYVEDLKFSGKKTNITRKIVDQKEEELVQSTCKLDRAKNKYDRISTTLISAKSGIKHLHDRLEKICSELTSEKIEFDDLNPAASLWSIGNILVELIARTREQEMNELHDENYDEYDDDVFVSSDIHLVENLYHVRPFNQRVMLPSAKDDNIYNMDRNSPEIYNDLDEEELSRDKVKKTSTQILRTATRTRRTKAKF